VKCRRLLFKWKKEKILEGFRGAVVVEIKCPKCSYVDTFIMPAFVNPPNWESAAIGDAMYKTTLAKGVELPTVRLVRLPE
jgi:phage FluMu protein Com